MYAAFILTKDSDRVEVHFTGTKSGPGINNGDTINKEGTVEIKKK